LLQVYRRLEARGEIRGGRFITGVAGEQFALGETVKQLRKLRDDGPQQELVIVCGADPLNLVGILTNQPRVPSTASNRIAYLDGKPVAALQGGELQLLVPVSKELHATLSARLSGHAEPADLEELAAGPANPQPVPVGPEATELRETGKKPKRPEYPNRIPRPTIY
jgi:ATP-dependent Lhr-like helicase